MLITKPVNAEPDINAPLPIPSVPEFTIKYVNYSYDVPATTTSHTDPYTGKVTTEIHQGYHVKNFTLEITIKNQAFPASIAGDALGMRYFIQTKGHFENDWQKSHVDTLSTSGYTIVVLPANSYPAGGTVDVRVMAWLGYYTPPVSDGKLVVPASFLYPRPSDWGSIQSISIPENINTPTSTSNQNNHNSPTTNNNSENFPEDFSLNPIVVGILVLIVGVMVGLVYFKWWRGGT
ncbi:MAG: hypothetical protein LBI79_09020 [Nitrososphaerota archaeon]|nr:hypothetical protein [Nitrososphaerota archaeon]